MTSANVTTEGRASGLLKGAHISRVGGLTKRRQQHCIFFFKSHMQSMNYTLLMMNRWHIWGMVKVYGVRASSVWLLHRVLDLELLFLQFSLSLRSLAYSSCQRLLISLENNSPLTHAEFLTGRFVTQKTRRKVHEQLNAIVKGDGGIIGITENEAALTRWMVSGPETARLVMEYDEKHSLKRKDTDRHH